MDDMELYAEMGIDAVIDARSERGKRLAKRFADLPKGMTWVEFCQRPEIADLDLDFITAHEMFKAYEESK
jgi:hypothetical protein